MFKDRNKYKSILTFLTKNSTKNIFHNSDISPERWYLKLEIGNHVNYKFQPKVSDNRRGTLIKAMSFNALAIVTVDSNDYKTHFLM